MKFTAVCFLLSLVNGYDYDKDPWWNDWRRSKDTQSYNDLIIEPSCGITDECVRIRKLASFSGAELDLCRKSMNKKCEMFVWVDVDIQTTFGYKLWYEQEEYEKADYLPISWYLGSIGRSRPNMYIDDYSATSIQKLQSFFSNLKGSRYFDIDETQEYFTIELNRFYDSSENSDDEIEIKIGDWDFYQNGRVPFDIWNTLRPVNCSFSRFFSTVRISPSEIIGKGNMLMLWDKNSKSYNDVIRMQRITYSKGNIQLRIDSGFTKFLHTSLFVLAFYLYLL